MAASIDESIAAILLDRGQELRELLDCDAELFAEELKQLGFAKLGQRQKVKNALLADFTGSHSSSAKPPSTETHTTSAPTVLIPEPVAAKMPPAASSLNKVTFDIDSEDEDEDGAGAPEFGSEHAPPPDSLAAILHEGDGGGYYYYNPALDEWSGSDDDECAGDGRAPEIVQLRREAGRRFEEKFGKDPTPGKAAAAQTVAAVADDDATDIGSGHAGCVLHIRGVQGGGQKDIVFKMTLNAGLLSRPFAQSVLEPFVRAFNKKTGRAVQADAIEYVLINGDAVRAIELPRLASSLLGGAAAAKVEVPLHAPA